MRTPESHEKEAIKKHLVEREAWYFIPYSAGYGASGVPDIIGSYRGRFFGIEVKRPGKQPTLLQDRRMKAIEKAGGKTFWGTAEKVIGEFEAWIA